MSPNITFEELLVFIAFGLSSGPFPLNCSYLFLSYYTILHIISSCILSFFVSHK